MPEEMTEQEQREAWLAIGHALASADGVRRSTDPNWGAAVMALGREMERLKNQNAELRRIARVVGAGKIYTGAQLTSRGEDGLVPRGETEDPVTLREMAWKALRQEPQE